MHTYSPPTFWFGRCQPWDFISVWRPLFHQSHSSDPSWVLLLLYPSTVLPKGLTDLCTSFLGHSPPPPPFAHTSDQSVSSDFTEDIKNGACTANVLTETRAQDSAPLALTSVWRRCRNIFNRFKKKKDKKKKIPSGRGRKKQTWVQLYPFLKLHYLLTIGNSLPTTPVLSNQKHNKSNLRRDFWTILSFSI